jgi:hypothetical protein
MPDQLVNIDSDVAAHSRADDLSRLVHTVAMTAADERRTRLSDGLEELAGEAGLDAEAATVGDVDLFATLRQGAPPAKARLVVAVLLARAIAASPPADEAAADRLAERLCWLSTSSWLDALAVVPAQLDDDVERRFWAALTRLVQRSDEGAYVSGRGPALAAAAALASSSSPAAEAARTLSSSAVSDPLVGAALRGGATPSKSHEGGGELGGAEVSGELVPAPLGPVGLILQAMTGILILRYVGRLLGKLLGLKRPSKLTVGGKGVTLSTELSVLGRTLRQRELVIPADNLARAMREARFPRLSLYAGLITLSIGTYFGASLATDGVRVGSPSLLGVGAALVGLGVVVDLVFANLIPAGKGSHRVVLVPRRGRKIAVAVADRDAADQALRSLSLR